MKKSFALVLVGCSLMMMVGTGCSNKPSDDEMKQLTDLKAEVASLEKDIAARESEKAALVKTIADKDAQLARCSKDKEALQSRIKGM
jgi:septal ring factor EnvC (AmiA/AmiB activator)